jgi:hypothetical protein
MNGMSEGPDVSMLIGVTVHIKVVYLGGYGWQPGKSGPSFTSRPFSQTLAEASQVRLPSAS